MRLLRITQHLKAQNWLAVFLDFLIVVIGVFIGLQVSNWNQERQGYEHEKKILQELTEDLQADLQELDIVLYFNKMRYSADVTLLQRAINWQIPEQYPFSFAEYADFDKPETETPRTASDALYFSTRLADFHMEQRTYTKLLSGDNVKFTHVPGLPEKLRQHYNFAQQWVDGEKGGHAPMYRTLIDTYNKHGIGILDTPSWEELETLIAREPQLQGLLKSSVWYCVVQYIFLTDIKRKTEALIEQIKQPA